MARVAEPKYASKPMLEIITMNVVIAVTENTIRIRIDKLVFTTFIQAPAHRVYRLYQRLADFTL